MLLGSIEFAAPLTQPSPTRGEGFRPSACNSVPSPLVGEGQGEGAAKLDLSVGSTAVDA
jgi:hypothetical protein